MMIMIGTSWKRGHDASFDVMFMVSEDMIPSRSLCYDFFVLPSLTCEGSSCKPLPPLIPYDTPEYLATTLFFAFVLCFLLPAR